MKKVKLNGKLSLNKETVSRLNENEMANVKAGGFLSIGNCTVVPDRCGGGGRLTKGLFCQVDSL